MSEFQTAGGAFNCGFQGSEQIKIEHLEMHQLVVRQIAAAEMEWCFPWCRTVNIFCQAGSI